MRGRSLYNIKIRRKIWGSPLAAGVKGHAPWSTNLSVTFTDRTVLVLRVSEMGSPLIRHKTLY